MLGSGSSVNATSVRMVCRPGRSFVTHASHPQAVRVWTPGGGEGVVLWHLQLHLGRKISVAPPVDVDGLTASRVRCIDLINGRRVTSAHLRWAAFPIAKPGGDSASLQAPLNPLMSTAVSWGTVHSGP